MGTSDKLDKETSKWHKRPSKLIWYKLDWTRRQHEICQSHNLSERIILECKTLQLTTKPWKECGPKAYLIWAMFHAQNKENSLDTTTKLNETRKTNEIANSTVFQPKEYTWLHWHFMPLQLSKMTLHTQINTNDWSWKTNINYRKTIRPSQNWKHKIHQAHWCTQ